MTNAEKTVFLSYRREPSQFLAAYVYDKLTAYGFDVFMDVDSIDSGDFEQVILNQIAARMHFIAILTPESVKRFGEHGDWLRREIEYAMDLQRNIVPVITDNFDFGARKINRYLTGKLANLPRYNALPIPVMYREAAIEKLRTERLKQPAYPVIITEPPPQDHPIIERKQAEAQAQPAPTERELTAEEWYQQGIEKFEKRDYDGAFTDFIRAIEFNPNYAEAYNGRGNIKYTTGDFDGAITDYTLSIELKHPELHKPYSNRGAAHRAKGELNAAIANYTEAIRLNPKHAIAHRGLGDCAYTRKQYAQALEHYQRYLELADSNPSSFVVKRVTGLKKQLKR